MCIIFVCLIFALPMLSENILATKILQVQQSVLIIIITSSITGSSITRSSCVLLPVIPPNENITKNCVCKTENIIKLCKQLRMYCISLCSYIIPLGDYFFCRNILTYVYRLTSTAKKKYCTRNINMLYSPVPYLCINRKI